MYYYFNYVVFKQSAGKISFDDPYQPQVTNGRNNTSTRQLITKYNLGKPVAGNFFQAEYDNFVPKLYAKLAANAQQ